MKEALHLIAAHEASAVLMEPTPGKEDMWQTVREMHLSTAAVLRTLIAEPDERMLVAGAQAMGIMGNKLCAGDIWNAMAAARHIEVSPTSVNLVAGLRAQRDALREREKASSLLLRDSRLSVHAMADQLAEARKVEVELRRAVRRRDLICWSLPAIVAVLLLVHQVGWRWWWPFQ